MKSLSELIENTFPARSPPAFPAMAKQYVEAIVVQSFSDHSHKFF
jgi:hypothetical protein